MVHRYLYYILSESLIDDYTYDMWEWELKKLVSEHPQEAGQARYGEMLCPTRCVGSSNADDYLPEIRDIAESLLNYSRKKHGKS